MGVGDFISLVGRRSLFSRFKGTAQYWCPLAALLRVPDYMAPPETKSTGQPSGAFRLRSENGAGEQMIDRLSLLTSA
jgi:hypothetical protein